MNSGSEDPSIAKRVVSKKGVAAARRRLEPGECVVRRAYEAGVREWCSCAEGMQECPPPSSSWRQQKLTIKAGAGPKKHEVARV